MYYYCTTSRHLNELLNKFRKAVEVLRHQLLTNGAQRWVGAGIRPTQRLTPLSLTIGHC